MAYTFTHRLDCALRMVDTTSGRTLPTERVHIFRQGQEIFPMRKAGGFFLFMGTGRHDFDIEIRAEGFEAVVQELRFAEPDGAPLVLDVQMIPKPGEMAEDSFFTLEGADPGMRALDAVSLSENACLARSYEKRRGILTLFNPHRLELDMVFYAIVNPDDGSYEAIRIEQRLTDETCQVAPAPQKEIAAHFPLCRRVLGRMEPDGRYLMRLRRSAGRRWIVRTVTDEGERFEVVDIQKAEADSRSREPPD